MKRAWSFFLILGLLGACAAEPGAAPSPGATCERDREALLWLDGVARACTQTSECPAGSHCDGAHCAWQCYQDSDCGAGKACTCDGTCVAAPERQAVTPLVPFSLDQPLEKAPRLDVTPASAVAIRPGDPDAAGPRVVAYTLQLATGFAELAAPGATQPTVRIEADPEVQVSCASDADVTGLGFGPSCTLSAWSYTQVGPEYRASHAVWARIAPAPGSTRTSWNLTITSSATTNARRVVGLRLPDAYQQPNGTRQDGDYQGQLVLLGSDEGEPVLDTELLADASFEGQTSDQVSGPWVGDGPDIPSYGWGSPGYTKGVDRGRASAHTGANDAWISTSILAGDSAGVHQDVTVQPDSAYRAAIWIATGNVSPLGWFGVRRADGTVLRSVTLQGHAAYTRVELDFRTAGETRVSLFVQLARPGTFQDSWARFDDASLRRRIARKGPARVVPVRAVATSDDRLVILDDTRQLAPSGRLPFHVIDDPDQLDEPWVTPRPGDVLDPRTDGGALGVSITHTPTVDPRPGMLSGTFTVSYPTSPRITEEWSFELTRQADVAEKTCAQGCGEGTVCDAWAGLCLPGAAEPAPVAGNSLHHSGRDGWLAAFDQRVLEAAAGFSLARIPAVYGLHRADKPDGRVDTVDLAGIDTIRGRAQSGVFADLGYELCQRDLMVHNLVFATFPRPASDTLSCPPSDDGQPIRNLCDRLYHRRTFRRSALTGACRATELDPVTVAATRRDYLPCVMSGTTADSPGNTFDTALGVADPSCQTFYDRTYPAGAVRPGMPSVQTYLQQKCVLADFVLRRYGNPLAHGSATDHAVYLCPVWEQVFGATSGQDVVERLSCWKPDVAPGTSALESARFGTTMLDKSGELRCRNNELPNLAPAFVVNDGSVARTPGGLVDDCLAELRAGPGSSLGQLAARTVCLSQARFWPALRAMTLAPGPMLGRLLQQWVAIHSLVAKEKRTEWLAASTVSAASVHQPGDPGAATLGELALALDQLEKGWDLVLDAQVDAALFDAGAQALWRADYRPSLVPTLHARLDDDQVVGLPVAMLEGLASHLRLVDSYLERAAIESFGDCRDGRRSEVADAARDRLGASLRYASAVEALASRLTVGPDPSGNQAPDWSAAYATARRELEGVRRTLVDRGLALRRCENPLGLDDRSLPLFFVEPVGENGRYFAASDHLVDQWAGPAVTTAQHTYTEAHDAWLAARNSALQQEMNENDRGTRVIEIQRNYGRQIAERCGLTDRDAKDVLDAFDPQRGGTLTAETCHIRLERPECRTAEGIDADPSCLRGHLGDAVLVLKGAKQDVDIARSSYNDHLDTVDKRTRYCMDLHRDLDEDGRILDAHNQRMRTLRNEKEIFDVAATLLDHSKECFGVDEFLTGAGGKCAASMIAGAMKSISIEYQRVMDQAEQDHKDFMQKRANMRQVAACFFEADLAKVGLDTARLQIQRRTTDAQLQMVRIDNLREQVGQLVAEGRAAVEREEHRRIPSLAHHYWYDEKVARFEAELAWAKKMTYLAVMAVEFDYQVDLHLRGAVAAARHPDQLEAVILAMAPYRAPRAINGARPGELKQVLSLRADLLGLGHDTDVEELRRRLRSPENAVYDRTGQYLGQGISFTLSEQGAMALRCGERLWRVTAAVSTEQAPLWGQVPLLVLKRNSFESQYCTGHGDGRHYQVGQTGSRSIFSPAQEPTEERSFSAAQLNAPANVDRDTFKGDQFTQGASTELAGRGLYGEYLLVFPWHGLLDGSNDPAHPFDFGQLDDVLLRFDSLSVANVQL